MKWCIQYSLFCDNAWIEDEEVRMKCERETDPHFSRKECKDQAKEFGWLIRRGVVLCPTCQKKREGKVEA